MASATGSSPIPLHLPGVAGGGEGSSPPRRAAEAKMAASSHQKLLSIGTKIVAVGRNYAAHAKELGNAVPKVIHLPGYGLILRFSADGTVLW